MAEQGQRSRLHASLLANGVDAADIPTGVEECIDMLLSLGRKRKREESIAQVIRANIEARVQERLAALPCSTLTRLAKDLEDAAKTGYKPNQSVDLSKEAKVLSESLLR